jgi:prepilin-type N-terminal cleavage/methylation domain-containing protein
MQQGFGDTRGFTLIETLVAVMVLTVALVGPLTLAQKSLSSASVSKEQIGAYFLGQDAIEYVKNVRDANQKAGRTWLSGISHCLGASCVIDTTVSSPSSALRVANGSYCEPLRFDASLNRYGCTASWAASPYRRYVSLESVGSNNREVVVAVTIQWTSGSFTKTYEATQSLFNVADAIQQAASSTP